MRRISSIFAEEKYSFTDTKQITDNKVDYKYIGHIKTLKNNQKNVVKGWNICYTYYENIKDTSIKRCRKY